MNKRAGLISIFLFIGSCFFEQGVLAEEKGSEKIATLLPKNKFIFIEVTEGNEGQAIEHYGSSVNPHVTKEEAEPPAYGYKFDKRNRLLTMYYGKRRGGSAFGIENFPRPEISNIIAITGYNLGLYAKKGSTTAQEITFLETLPSLLRLSERSEEYYARAHKIRTNWTRGPSAPLVRWPSLNLIEIGKDGSIVIKHENKKIPLTPGAIWESESEVRTGVLKLKKVRLSIRVKNYGVFDKNNDVKIIETKLKPLR